MKFIKVILAVVLVVGVVGFLAFGKNFKSYMHTSAKQVKSAVTDAVPTEFELQRARDLLEEIIPDMHANIKLISQEEVEIAALHTDIDGSTKPLEEQKIRIQKMKDGLDSGMMVISLDSRQYNREEVKADLVRNFERYKEAQVVYESKKRLLTTREKGLQNALAALDKTRNQKLLLEDRINALESQYRLVKATAATSRVDVDNSKLAQTEQLIAQIKKRLDVAERVLAHETRFIEPVMDAGQTVSDEELIKQVNDYFEPHKSTNTTTPVVNTTSNNAVACQVEVE